MAQNFKLVDNVKYVTVYGGGQMGGGIAQTVAAAGYYVTIAEINQSFADKGIENIRLSLKRLAKRQLKTDNVQEHERHIEDVLSRIKTTTDLKDAVKNADLVIEAIIETIEAKRELFALIDKVAPQHTIFASNTSSLLIADMAAVTNRKDRFGGLHFFQPVPLMRLAEVIRTADTSDKTHDTIKAFGQSIGKTCITCKDTPGFVVNRLLNPYVMEAIKMVERGDCTARDVDIGMKLGAGYPMGPIELADMVGLDVCLFIQEGIHKRNPDKEGSEPSRLLTQLVKDGKLGVKSGEGFYKYKLEK